jgi:hypothetical protein
MDDQEYDVQITSLVLDSNSLDCFVSDAPEITITGYLRLRTGHSPVSVGQDIPNTMRPIKFAKKEVV